MAPRDGLDRTSWMAPAPHRRPGDYPFYAHFSMGTRHG